MNNSPCTSWEFVGEDLDGDLYICSKCGKVVDANGIMQRPPSTLLNETTLLKSNCDEYIHS